MLVCCLCHFLKLEHAEGAGLVFSIGLHRRQKPHPGLGGKGHRLLGFAVLQLCIERAVPREAADQRPASPELSCISSVLTNFEAVLIRFLSFHVDLLPPCVSLLE